MDATVNDFFNEINEMGGKKEKSKVEDDVWQECQDERTGFPYYWNTKTDEVSWTKPKSFRPVRPKRPKSPEKKGGELFLPPASAIHSTPSPKGIKIYSLQDSPKPVAVTTPIFTLPSNSNAPSVEKSQQTKKPEKKPLRRKSDSDDEKIELITSYGGDSDSESETEVKKPVIKKEEKPMLPETQDDSEEDEEDLLAKIQKRAKELKALGGDVPPEVKNIINKPSMLVNKPAKVIAGFSLVGAYSDSDEEGEEIRTIIPKAALPTVFNPTSAPVPTNSVPPVSGHSTLFPITKPLDVNDFIGPPVDDEVTKTKETSSSQDIVDNKVFQRKRRIGVSLVNTKRPKEDIQNGDNEHKGFGFKKESNVIEPINNSASLYVGFQKGGVMFVKPDDINHKTPENTTTNIPTNDKPAPPPVETFDHKVENILDDDIEAVFKKAEAEDTYNMIKEKLSFLGEGRSAVLPVQVMLIQAETLFMAMKENALKVSYLQNWLQQTGTELISLEKQAAPEGWLLQWDRSHKRYYYQNQHTGETQWQYPEPDVDRCDEAMDICTTPPPIHDPPPPVIGPSLRPTPRTRPPNAPAVRSALPPQIFLEPPPPPPPPSPPRIRHPSPPPAPIISSEENSVNYSSTVPTAVMFNVPLPPSHSLGESQPLPPGVDVSDTSITSNQLQETPSADFNFALDSFYSEIAEATVDSPDVPSEEHTLEVTEAFMNGGEEPKKKKKKVKTAGLSLKRKGVSQLVEKWKNVQNDF